MISGQVKLFLMLILVFFLISNIIGSLRSIILTLLDQFLTLIFLHLSFLLFYKFLKKFRLLREIFKVFVVNDFNINELINSGYGSKKFIILDGYFQSYIFANSIHYTIFKSHTYYTNTLNDITIKNQVLRSSSVCLHLRHYNSDTLNCDHEINDFYIKAVAKLRERIAKPKFFIFSDISDFDIRFLKLTPDEVVFVDSDKSVDPISDIYLMSLCKFYIFTGSTFCYWSIFLSNDFKELVICSSLILKDKYQSCELPFYPSNWLLI